MKLKMIRAIAIALSLVMLLPLCISCGEENSTVMQGDGIKINEEAYEYWYIQLKDYYIDSFSDLVDEIPFWNSKMPESDVTYGAFIDEKIRTQIKYYLAGIILFERYDLSLSETVVSNIDRDIDDGINAFGSRSKYDAYLEERYGVNSRSLRKIKIMEQKFYAVYTHLYDSKNGIEKATDSEIEAFYNDNFARIKYYMVLKKFDYVYDDKGNRVIDSNNRYEMTELDEKGQLENKQHAEEVLAKVKEGENIDTYIKKYYSDLAKLYPNGYYVLENDKYGAMFTPTLIRAAFSLDVSGVTICENEDAYFVVQRLSLPDKAYLGVDKDQFGSISSDAVEKKFIDKFNTVIDEIEIDDEVFAKYSVITVR